MNSDLNRNVGRIDLSGKLGSIPAPRETYPTPVSTHPGVRPPSTMVTRSRAREGCDVNTVPEVEFRPGTDIPAETCEEGLEPLDHSLSTWLIRTQLSVHRK